MKISVVIPVYNEQGNITPLVDQVYEALKPSKYDFETILINDGSKDKTVEEIKQQKGKNVVLIDLRKNFGQCPALKAGIDYATGDIIATLDGDLQNDPADLIKMMEVMEETGCDVVTGIRAKRKDGMLLRKIPSKIANALVRKVSDTPIIDNGCAIKVFKSEVAKDIPLYGEMHRFIAILAINEGARVEQIPVNHRARVAGESKYGLSRTFKVVSDLILMRFTNKYAQKPMHFLGPIGAGSFTIGVILMFYLLIVKLMGQDIWGRPLIFAAIIFLFGGFQLIMSGITLDLLMRTNHESQEKKIYKVRKREAI
ncbi:glycosyltransferase family 2 protein [Saccharicrinis fermentans]|uniref:Undecaprenyl-phosphate 4-deoxy-4-formamido-L-arabinose transferase n=1 Tax=Saccharicrinis fermentans DSM 9555 = JCM 21142 TaxID=869213 RepID=W7Y428_9BACT|nr:glycosyltransferase family 2 protein [Saccharicrinis fermentans]GAF02328.1 undecaprenyl-phosphate 4-deoxy-4-formamido-L-arabinose transferase [Saccharicrinis fermentans DSM 9555 = JCM 21142]